MRWMPLAVLAVAGCATTSPFVTSFPTNNRQAIDQALSRVKPHANTPSAGRPLIVMVTQGPGGLLAYDMEARRVLWSVEGAVNSRVVVGTKTAVYATAGGDVLVARALSNGKQLWRMTLPAGGVLTGVSQDGGAAYAVVEQRGDGGSAAGREETCWLLAVDASSGSLRWRKRAAVKLGVPVARDGLVFVPLRHQELAIVDGLDGRELARSRFDEALSWVRSLPEGVYWGGAGGDVHSLSVGHSAGGASRQDGGLAGGGLRPRLPSLGSSAAPAFWLDSYHATASYGAQDRNRLLWRVASPGGSTRLLDDVIALHHYRFVLGFRPVAEGEPPVRESSEPTSRPSEAAPRLLWAYVSPREDIVASADTGGSMVLVTAAGDVIVLDPRTGQELDRNELGVKVLGAAVDADGYTVGSRAAEPQDLQSALVRLIWDRDKRFDWLKQFAVEQLARLPGRAVSEQLLRIVMQSGPGSDIAALAATLLVDRKDKAAIPTYLRALRRRYNYATDSEAPAVDVLARALGAVRAPEAVEALLGHLADHETPIAAIKDIAEALGAIGDRSVVDPLREFLLTYRCDPQFAADPSALRAVVAVLRELGGKDEQRLLAFVANDVHTVAPLRQFLTSLESVSEASKPDSKSKPASPSK